MSNAPPKAFNQETLLCIQGAHDDIGRTNKCYRRSLMNVLASILELRSAIPCEIIHPQFHSFPSYDTVALLLFFLLFRKAGSRIMGTVHTEQFCIRVAFFKNVCRVDFDCQSTFASAYSNFVLNDWFQRIPVGDLFRVDGSISLLPVIVTNRI